MKVCLVGFDARKDIGGGIPRYTFELLLNLNKVLDRHSSIVFSGFGNYLTNPLLRSLKKASFATRVHGIRADIYHAVTPQLAIPLILAMKRPIVVTVHDLLPLYRGISSTEYRLSKAIFRRCDMIISKSEYFKNDLVHYFNVPEDRIVTVHLGVDLNFFKPMQGMRGNSNERIILYIGGLTIERGLTVLLRAFKEIVKKTKGVRLLVGGRGSDEPYFKGVAEQLGVREYVTFLGFIPEKELPFYYNMADVFVWPSHIGFGLMILEAMACGTPVISVRRFDVPEYVGDAAILVKPGNANELAEAILKILSDDKLRRTLSNKGLKRVREFSWEKCALNTLRVYERLICGHIKHRPRG